MSDNTDSLIAYKSLDTNYPIWRVFNHEETKLMCPDTLFGGFVFKELNIFNCFFNADPAKKYNYPIEEVEYITKEIKKDGSWLNYYKEIKDFLLNIKNVDNSDLFYFYEKYKFFTVAFHKGESFNGVITDMEKGNPSKYNIDDFITFKGYGLQTFGMDDIRCEKYEIEDGTKFFILDLWLVLFDKAIKPKVCAQCGDFFMADYGKNKYCDDCNTKDVMQKRRYQQRNGDEVQYYRKRIYEFLMYHNVSPDLFLKELDYYCDKIHNKPVEFNPNYDNNIKTKDDLINWLKAKHKSLKEQFARKRRNKNGKTNEASERNGSDNQSVGQTQETVPSDDNSGLER